jgi:hypothetical protein
MPDEPISSAKPLKPGKPEPAPKAGSGGGKGGTAQPDPYPKT